MRERALLVTEIGHNNQSTDINYSNVKERCTLMRERALLATERGPNNQSADINFSNIGMLDTTWRRVSLPRDAPEGTLHDES